MVLLAIFLTPVIIVWVLDIGNLLIQWFVHDVMMRYFFPNGLNLYGATPLFWLLLTTLLVADALAFRPRTKVTPESSDYDYSQGKYVTTPEKREHKGSKAAFAVLTVLAVFAGAAFVPSLWDNDKDAGASFAQANTFVVEDLKQQPATLKWLLEGAQLGSPDCDVTGSHDVDSCIQEGEILDDWVPRVASATGAEQILRKSAESESSSELMGQTKTYLYGEDDSGLWTAIRDGKKAQRIIGIMEWNGQGVRTTGCNFEGDFELDYAWNGLFGHRLHDEIVDQYPGKLFDTSDMWGYCRTVKGSENREPVIVIPTYEQQGYGHRTTLRAGGVLSVTGSPSGEPVISYDPKVEVGEYPGPVYPLSLAKKQRELLKWSAGRHNNWWRDFGYETSTVASQEGNPSEYVLKSAIDGRLYIVTPGKPRSGDTERIVATSVIPADTATAGQLNPQRVFVLHNDDPRIVDLQRLYDRAYDAVNTEQPAFFTESANSAAGTLVEFLPINGDTWQVYAERGGNVKYRVDVPVDEFINPTVTDVSQLYGGNPEPGQPQESPQQSTAPGDPNTGTPGAINCDAPAELTDAALAQCLSQLTTELQRRTATTTE